jgi:hypothetical protein
VQIKDYSKSLPSLTSLSSSRRVNTDNVQWEKFDLVTNQQDADYSPLMDYSNKQNKKNTGSVSLLQKLPPSSLSFPSKNYQPEIMFDPTDLSPQERRRRRAAVAATQKRRRRRKVIKICIAFVVLIGAIATGRYFFSSFSTESSSSQEINDEKQALLVQEAAAAAIIEMESTQQEITDKHEDAHHVEGDAAQDAEFAYNQEDMVHEATAVGQQEFGNDDNGGGRGGQGAYLDTPLLLQIIQKLCFGSWMFGKKASHHHGNGQVIRTEHVEEVLSCMMQ